MQVRGTLLQDLQVFARALVGLLGAGRIVSCVLRDEV